MRTDEQWMKLLRDSQSSLLERVGAADLLKVRWTEIIPESYIPRIAEFYVYANALRARAEAYATASPRTHTAQIKDAFTVAFLEEGGNLCYILSVPIRSVKKMTYLNMKEVSVKTKKVGWRDLAPETVEETKGLLREILYQWLLEVLTREAARRRSERIHEELVAAVWRPDRMARRLETGGWDAVEAMI